jgi:hypothetical protein
MATPPDFSVGQVLTAAHMDAVGLWLIKTQTIGTAVSSVAVTDAFSADYDNYLITICGGVASVGNALGLQLGATTTNYSYSFIFNGYANTVTGLGTTTGANFLYAGAGNTTSLHMYAAVTSPYLAENTYCFSNSVNASWAGTMNGYLPNTTQYTDFTIVPSSGTITGGTIRVYGYRN